MTPATILASLLGNKGHVAGYATLLVMVVAAYITQASAIQKLSLEVGELRAETTYKTETIQKLTKSYGQLFERCDKTALGIFPSSLFYSPVSRPVGLGVPSSLLLRGHPNTTSIVRTP